MNNISKIRALLKFKPNETVKTITITPEIASELLVYNTHNRPRQKSREREYAEDMKIGKFGMQESMVSFDENGVLTNGQTRLYACVRANTSFKTTVFIGLAQNIHMDTGKTRSIVDNVKLNDAVSDYMNCNNVSIKVVNEVLRIKHNIYSRVRVEELVEFCKKYGSYIDDLYNLSILSTRGNPSALFKVQISAAFLIAYLNGVEIEDLKHIREILTSGQSVSDCDIIIQKFRDKLMQIQSNGGISSALRIQVYCGTQYVIWCYTQGKKVKRVIMNNEYYPIPN